MSADDQKRASGEAAAALVEDGMTLGLGTGSTAAWFVEAVASRAAVEGLKLRCVATSDATAYLAAKRGLTLIDLNDAGDIDLTVDRGSIHGIIGRSAKRVKTLGKFPLPVEVVAFGHKTTARRLFDALAECELGAAPALRVRDGQVVMTDNGGVIYDIACGVIPDPSLLADALKSVTGVVEHGLFLDLADEGLIGTDAGVERISP